MFERCRHHGRVFGQIVPPAQTHRIDGIGLCDETLGGLVVECAALEQQTADGREGQGLEIAGLDGAEIAFGCDMQTYGLDQSWRKPSREITRRDILMLHVDAARRGFFVIGDQMADVMEQRCGNQGRRCVLALGQGGALQRML